MDIRELVNRLKLFRRKHCVRQGDKDDLHLVSDMCWTLGLQPALTFYKLPPEETKTNHRMMVEKNIL